MKMIFRVAALAAAALVASAPALADIQVKDATGATVATCSATDGSHQVPCHNVVPLKLTGTDIGASVAANTATQLVAATSNRFAFSLQNQTAGDCWFSTIANATADYHSTKIPAGALFESNPFHISTGAISVICQVAGGVAGRQTTN